MQNSAPNPGVDNVLAGLDTGLSPDLAGVIVDPHASLPFDAPPPPPERRPAARASTGPANGPLGPSKTEMKQMERDADQHARARMSPLLGRKFGEIARRFPGAERVRIRKRGDDGSAWFINDYAMRDLGIDDIEAFIAKYVKPKHGGGHYDLAVLNASGQEFDAGFVRVMNEPTTSQGGDTALVGVVQNLIERNQQMMFQHMQPQPQPDLLEQMRRVKEFEKELGGGGGNPMMLMLMQQMQPRGPDPLLMQMLQAQQEQNRAMMEALKEIKNGSSGGAMMPPPPPAPSFDMAGLTALLSSVAVPIILELLKSRSAGPDPNGVTKQDVQLMVQELQMRLMSGGEAPNPLEIARETIGLFRELHGGEKQQSLQEKLGEMQALRELAKEVVGNNGQSRSETNFWDAAAGLLANKAFGEGVGKTLGAAMERFTPSQQQGPRMVTLSGNSATPPQTQSTPKPAGNLPQQAPQQAQPRPPVIEIPDDFPVLVEKIETASDDKQRIEAVINALYTLRNLEQWKPFVQGLLGATAKNERDAALKGLHGWLKVLIGNNLLQGATGHKVMETFVKNWDAIHTTIANMMGMASQAEPPAPASAAPAPAAPAPAAQEGPGDEDEQEQDGDDEQAQTAAPSGPPPHDIDLPADMQPQPAEADGW